MTGTPSNSPWPGQCPGGVASSAVGCLPQARAPGADDVIPIWQTDETPPTRGMQLKQLLNEINVAITFNPLDFVVNDGTVSLASTITVELLNAGTIAVNDLAVNTGTVTLTNLPTSDAGLAPGRLFLNGNFLCVAGV